MFVVTSGLSVLSYIVYNFLRWEDLKQIDDSYQAISVFSYMFGLEFFSMIRQILFFAMILSLITPVLGSLTVTYTDDTIILGYFIFVLIHLIYYDFEKMNTKPPVSLPTPKPSQSQATTPNQSGVSVGNGQF
mmetsp:Transcript_4550/g.6883  ORF Transcript_4550/g.6883 Transcript_4550/m.6883 type:complete len:132 (-) Transcript_4550:479-874(-)